MKPKTITLNPGEWILSAVPEFIHGPGWSNQLVWVHIANNDGTFRTVDIQSDQMTPEMWILFEHGSAMHQAILSAVPVKKVKAKPCQ